MAGSRVEVCKVPLGREAYFDAAFKILATSGFPGLSVNSLSANLGSAKSSFYHHFAGMSEFTDALVATWEFRINEIVAEMASRPPLEALTRCTEIIGQSPLQAYAGLRFWAGASPAVSAAVRRQDASWEHLILGWLSQVIPDPDRARVLAHLILAVLIGMFQLQRPPDAGLIHTVAMEILRNNIGLAVPMEQGGTVGSPFTAATLPAEPTSDDPARADRT